MAKDGTMRGGARPRSGPAKKDAHEKIREGKKAPVMKIPDLPVGETPAGVVMPKVEEWLKRDQKEGGTWKAEDLVVETYAWLKERGCDRLITMQQIYAYATAEARWIQCQEALSQYGFLAKHPTTGAPIESPYSKMAEKFARQAAAAWYVIFQVVKENCTEDYGGSTPHDLIMASLLAD